jgi:hypothetical protein
MRSARRCSALLAAEPRGDDAACVCSTSVPSIWARHRSRKAPIAPLSKHMRRSLTAFRLADCCQRGRPAVARNKHTDNTAACRLEGAELPGGWRAEPAWFRERTTGFEPATPTLARLCSTN